MSGEAVFLDRRMLHSKPVLDVALSRGFEIADDERMALTTWLNQVGERAVALEIGVSRQSITRALAGVGLYKTTHRKIRAALEKRQAR